MKFTYCMLCIVYETAIIKNSEEHQQIAGIDLVSYRMSFQSYYIVAIQILSLLASHNALSIVIPVTCTLDHYLYTNHRASRVSIDSLWD